MTFTRRWFPEDMNGVVNKAPTAPAAGAEIGDGGRLTWEPRDDVGMAACVAIVSAMLTSGLLLVRLLLA